MASGEWRVASGEWRVASGEWRVASGEWRVASGKSRGIPHFADCVRNDGVFCWGTPGLTVRGFGVVPRSRIPQGLKPGG